MTDKKLHRVGTFGGHTEPRFGGPYPVGDGISQPWYTNRLDQLIVGGFAGLAILGGLMASGVIFPQIVAGEWDPTLSRNAILTLPVVLALYTELGALTYVFTALAAYPHADHRTIKRFGQRIVIAPIIVSIGYLVLGPLLNLIQLPAAPEAIRVLAGMAFLFGLFIKHAITGAQKLAVDLIYKRIGKTLTRGIRP